MSQTLPEFHQSLRAFRQIFASNADEEVCWWYFGAFHVDIEGWPRISALHPVTIMVYRTETVSASEVRVHYREVGYFRNPITGALVDTWYNPITGNYVDAAKTFVEGPSTYTARQTGHGIALSLEQAHAVVDGLDVAVRRHGDRLLLTQNEYKSRGFPLPNGNMSASVAKGHTVLSFFASAAELESGVDCARSSGAYCFTLDSLPKWMGFGDLAGTTTVTGTVVKARPDEHINPEGWATLQGLFPDFFAKGEIRPIWD